MIEIEYELKKKIIDKLPIDEELFDNLFEYYKNSIGDEIKKHYLAHIIRSMEEVLKNVTKNPLFQIRVQPFESDDRDLKVTCAEYVKNCYFVIFYPKKMEEKQLRVMLAHELGHLFFVEIFNSSSDDNYTENSNTEPLATLFGIFAIIDKNDYYKKGYYRDLIHKSYDDILYDFSLFLNRKESSLNIS